MLKNKIIEKIVANRYSPNDLGVGIAPSNLALTKYWGKRDNNLNLPTNSSLAITLGYYGTSTIIRFSEYEQYFLNRQEIPLNSPFALRLKQFLDLFRRPNDYFKVETCNNLATASGFASSASGFAALTIALNDLYGWKLSLKHLSILSRLGSGSACRSLQHGFISWSKGQQNDGMDSYGTKIMDIWPELRIGIIQINPQTKKYSSREAMNQSHHSLHFDAWTEQSEIFYTKTKKAIFEHDFEKLGQLCETHTEMMHALINDVGIEYSCFDTFKHINRVKELRKKGIPIFYTQDAGANLFLITTADALPKIKKNFNFIEVNPKKPDDNTLILNIEKQKIPKIRAHILGEIHLAFSVIIYRCRNKRIEFLIQQRSSNKYHAANLWSNTCCGHPINEILNDAQYRLKEEMGFTLPLIEWGQMKYKTNLGIFVEHELDRFFWGNGSNLNQFVVNSNEVQNWQWIDSYVLISKINKHPEQFTPWFIKIIEWLIPRWQLWLENIVYKT